MRTEKRRRPFRVRAWSPAFNEYTGASFAKRGDAAARGVLYAQAGLLEIERITADV